MNFNNILAIHNESFNDNKTISYFENIGNIMIYEEENSYLILLDSVDVYEVFEIAVRPKFRNKGLASKLLNKLPKDKDIFLEVNEKNISAINLYKKNGYEKISIRKNYYAKDSAIIMCKKKEE